MKPAAAVTATSENDSTNLAMPVVHAQEIFPFAIGFEADHRHRRGSELRRLARAQRTKSFMSVHLDVCSRLCRAITTFSVAAGGLLQRGHAPRLHDRTAIVPAGEISV